MKLRVFVTAENHYRMGLLVLAIIAGLYYLTNHFPVFELRYLPMTYIDIAVPFIPVTIWVYVSEYLYYVVAYSSYKNEENVNKFLYAYISLSFFSFFIFFLWPTVYPRELFPLTNYSEGITKTVFSFLRDHMDSPTNCFPSHHVSSCFLLSFSFLHESRRKFILFFIWTILIAISTITTKQHYFADVISGFLTALLFYYVFFKLAKVK